MANEPAQTPTRLNQLLSESGNPTLPPETSTKFATYLALLQRWNAKTNLTAIRDEEGILSRHFMESILCAQNLPQKIVSLLDLGSGAGFPGIPIALIRNEITVTLAESQNKKSAFLREAVRTLGLQTKVHAGRAEQLQQTFDCVTLRAVDNMEQAIQAAIARLNPNGWLALLTTISEASTIQSTHPSLNWQSALPLPKDTNRVLLLGQNLQA
jgi:16S rRNA (guanine527-N7)-methyltransferase